ARASARPGPRPKEGVYMGAGSLCPAAAGRGAGAQRSGKEAGQAPSVVVRIWRAIGVGLVFGGRDRVAAREPALQVEVGAALRTERTGVRLRRAPADRAFALAHRAFTSKASFARPGSAATSSRAPKRSVRVLR